MQIINNSIINFLGLEGALIKACCVIYIELKNNYIS